MGLWIIAAVAAFFVKGLCGFANTLVFTSVMGFGSDNVSISPVELVLGLPTNLILAWRERRNLQPRVFMGLELLSREYGKGNMRESKVVLGVIGLAAGVLSGLFGVGALLAAYVSRVTDNSREFKANFSAVFIGENVFRMGLYGALGIITGDTLRQSARLMPFMLIGLIGGMKSSQVLNERVVRKLVIVLLIISGCVMIGSNV